MNAAFKSAVVAAACFIALPSTGCEPDDVVQDPTFKSWCGDKLCFWNLDQGAIVRAPTWHELDYGIDLVGAPVVLSQIVETTSIRRCCTVTGIADVAPEAQVALEFDFDKDGSVEVSRAIPSTNWEPFQFVVYAPVDFNGIRVALRKSAPGRAVIAELRVQVGGACATGSLPTPIGGKLRATCTNRTNCDSGFCTDGICSECDPRNANACGGAPNACRRRSASISPVQCNPGERTANSTRACLFNDDCKSGICDPIAPGSGTACVSQSCMESPTFTGYCR